MADRAYVAKQAGKYIIARTGVQYIEVLGRDGPGDGFYWWICDPKGTSINEYVFQFDLIARARAKWEEYKKWKADQNIVPVPGEWLE